MKAAHLLTIMMVILCACQKEGSSTGREDPRSRKQVVGTVVTNTCSCTHPWASRYPTIIRLDMPIGHQLLVYSTNLEDSFRIPGEKLRFDLEFVRDPGTNWCDGIPLPEEVQLFNVAFD